MGNLVEIGFSDKEAERFIKYFESKLKTIEKQDKKWIGLLSAIVYADVMKHYEEEEGSSGPWKDWSPSYKGFRVEGYINKLQKFQKNRKGKEKPKYPKILQYSGRLRQNFKPNDVRKSPLGPMWFNDAKTKKGFPYAAAHDEGGPKLPKRDFMWLSDKAMEKVADQTLQFMLDEGV